MNCRAKFDAAIFILGGEIRNRTNKHTHKNTKQTVTDVSTLCLSACVDKKLQRFKLGRDFWRTLYTKAVFRRTAPSSF